MDVEAKLERGRALKVRNVAPLPHAAPLSPNLVAYALSLSLSLSLSQDAAKQLFEQGRYKEAAGNYHEVSIISCADSVEEDIGRWRGPRTLERTLERALERRGRWTGERIKPWRGEDLGEDVGEDGEDFAEDIGEDVGEDIGEDAGENVGERIRELIAHWRGEDIGKNGGELIEEDSTANAVLRGAPLLEAHGGPCMTVCLVSTPPSVRVNAGAELGDRPGHGGPRSWNAGEPQQRSAHNSQRDFAAVLEQPCG